MDTNSEISLTLRKAEDLFRESVVLVPGEKQLHPDVMKFIVDKAKKLQKDCKVQISVTILESSSFDITEITGFIRTYFVNERERASERVSATIRLGVKSLIIAFAFLIVMYILTKVMMGLMQENAFLLTVRELFIILAWVALWRPAELLLYDWREHKQNATLFGRIAKYEVDVTNSAGSFH